MSSDLVYLLKAQLVTKEKKAVANVTESEECEQCEDLSFENVTDYLQHFSYRHNVSIRLRKIRQAAKTTPPEVKVTDRGAIQYALI